MIDRGFVAGPRAPFEAHQFPALDRVVQDLEAPLGEERLRLEVRRALVERRVVVRVVPDAVALERLGDPLPGVAVAVDGADAIPVRDLKRANSRPITV